MAETVSRQTRSNSLQRMLELEKQYMNERIRVGSNQHSYPGVTFNSLAASQQRPVSRGRDFDPQTVQERRRSEQRQRSFPLQTHAPKPKLVIDVRSSPSTPPAPIIRDPASNMKTRRANRNTISTPPSIPYSSTVEAFPTPISGTDNSVCQSPSWEAYDRRKQEKKEEERRAKDEAKASRKPRRLSKPPPASSPYGFCQSSPNQSEPSIIGNGRKARPASMVFPDSPSKDSGFYKQPRSRAGSFSSLIKTTFDFRRSSIDQSQDRPFIGGIKLEYEQHLANERSMSQQSAVDATEVHPALRKTKVNSSAALKSPPPPPRATSAKDPNSRAYPPNTFRTAKSKSMFLVSPTAPAIPDLSTIEKWRARVGFRSSSKSSSPVRSPQAKDVSPVRDTDSPLDKEKTKDTERAKRFENSTKQAVDIPSKSQEPSRKTPPPPEPPRRSSKRNSILSGSPSMPLLNAGLLHAPIETACSSLYDLPSTAGNDEVRQPSASPSWENLQSSVMNTIEHTIKPMIEVEKEDGEKQFWNSHEWPLQRSDYPPQITSSSSEDSASDCFNTVSMPSTPNTSRPQSEKGLPRFSGEEDRFTLPRIQLHDNAYPSEACSFVSASSFTGAYDTDREIDPIQAAARKVMAALPPMPSARPNMEHEPLKLRSKFTDTSSISDSSFMEVPKLSSKNHKNQPAKRNGDTVAKVFVECCSCKYYHDMPSKLYDAMVNPNSVLNSRDRTEFAGAISMTVKCPWCKHPMSTSCCAGLAAMVYVKERLH